MCRNGISANARMEFHLQGVLCKDVKVCMYGVVEEGCGVLCLTAFMNVSSVCVCV